MPFKLEWIILVDLLILALFIINIARGYKNGFLVSLINVVRFIAALIVASFLSGPVAKVFPLLNLNKGGLDLVITQALGIRGSESIWFILIFFGVYILSFLVIPIVKLLDIIPILDSLNKLLGLIFGAILGSLKVLIVYLLFTLPIFSNGEVVLEQSRLKHFTSSIKLVQVFTGEISDNLIFQKMVLNKPLQEKQEQEIEAWLKSMNLDEKSITEFLERFK